MIFYKPTQYVPSNRRTRNLRPVGKHYTELMHKEYEDQKDYSSLQTYNPDSTNKRFAPSRGYFSIDKTGKNIVPAIIKESNSQNQFTQVNLYSKN